MSKQELLAKSHQKIMLIKRAEESGKQLDTGLSIVYNLMESYVKQQKRNVKNGNNEVVLNMSDLSTLEKTFKSTKSNVNAFLDFIQQWEPEGVLPKALKKNVKKQLFGLG